MADAANKAKEPSPSHPHPNVRSQLLYIVEWSESKYFAAFPLKLLPRTCQKADPQNLVLDITGVQGNVSDLGFNVSVCLVVVALQ